MTDYPGIDYGLDTTNIDKNTGLRFGVIPAHHVGQYWYDASEPFYIYICPKCEFEFTDYEDICPSCKHVFDEYDFEMLEPFCHEYRQDGYKCFQSYDDPDIFIERAPFYSYAQFCSPCAPGACYLLNPLDEPDEHNKCYCFGHDWFESGRAPYPVYDIKTGELVERKTSKTKEM